jgi:hypothetical protein
MQQPKVTYHGPRPHVYVHSDLAPGDTLVDHRRKLEAARRAQAAKTKRRVLASLLRKG